MAQMSGWLHEARVRLKARRNFLLGFDNIATLKGNLTYAAYHALCRHNFRRLERAGLRTDRAAVEGFGSNAHYVLPPRPRVLSGLDALPTALLAKLDNPSSRTTYGFLTRHFLDQEGFESARHLLNDEVDAAIKSILGSYYMVTSAYLYRTVPSDAVPRSTFLWHVDDHPDCHLKLFFYLTDTYRTNGALQAHRWDSARDLKKRGFTDRRRVPPGLAADLDDEQRYTVVEGKRGTAILFGANTIHRAVIPERDRRDVLAFEFLPSPDPVVRYRNRHFTYWESPLDLLFAKPDAAAPVGAYD